MKAKTIQAINRMITLALSRSDIAKMFIPFKVLMKQCINMPSTKDKLTHYVK